MSKPLTPPCKTLSPEPETESAAFPQAAPLAVPPTDFHLRPERQVNGCRWIDGDVRGGDWRYCQAPRLRGRSYCAAHYRRSIDPDGDMQFSIEQAEIEHYLLDLPPVEDD